MQPIKLLIVSNGDSGGGIERFILNLLKYFKDKEANVDCKLLLLYSHGDVYYNEYRRLANRVYEPILSYSDGILQRLLKLKKQFSSIQPDCILSFSYWLAAEQSLICAYLKIPFLLAVRNTIPLNKVNAFIKSIPVNLFAKCCIANSSSVANYLITEWKIVRSKIVLINNGIVVDDFPPKNYTKKNTTDSFKILTVARLEPVKNHNLILKIAEIAKAKNLNWQFIWAGDGRMRSFYQDEIRKKALEKHIRLYGFQNFVSDLYRSSDVFLLTSHNEGMSQALLEACASALPVVVSNVPGMEDVVQHGVNGYRIKPEDVEGFFVQLQKLSEDFFLRKKLGTNSRQIVKSAFSFEDNAKIYQELLVNVCKKRTLI